MADEALARAGLYFDELNKIRLLKPKSAEEASDLRDEGKEFVTKISAYQSAADSLMQAVESLAKMVEKEKLKAMASHNALKSVVKQKEAERLQLQTLIREKHIELERLRIEYESAQHEEAEQRDSLQQFLAPM